MATKINPRTYKQIHTPTVGQGKWMDPPFLEFLLCCGISKRFHLQWKGFDLLNKLRCILWVVALLDACDVTNNCRHLEFCPKFKIRLKPREIVFFCN